MQKEKSRLVSMLTHDCPVCRQSSIYTNPQVYTFVDIGSMHKECPVCHASLVPETGFYFGAAYVSWGLTVTMWIAILVSLKTLDALGLMEFGFLTHPKTFLITGVIFTVILFPLLFKLSRSIWATSFIK